MISATRNYMFMPVEGDLHGDKIITGINYDLSEDIEQAYKQAKYIRGVIDGEWTACINGELQKITAEIKNDGIEIVFTNESTGVATVY